VARPVCRRAGRSGREVAWPPTPHCGAFTGTLFAMSQSPPDSLGAQPAPELTQPRRWLIVMSTSTAGSPLPGASEGAELLIRALEGVGEEVTVLVDSSPDKMTSSIRAALQENARTDRTLVVYFIGHSTVRADGPVLLMGSSARRTTQVSLRSLYDMLGGPGQKVLILDIDRISGADLMAYGGGSGIAVLSVSDRDEASSKTKTGLFASWLARGIETGEADLDGDGQIDISELHRYAAERLTGSAAPPNGTVEYPVLVLTGDPTEFVVARTVRSSRRRAPKLRMAERLPPLDEPFVDRIAELEELRAALERAPKPDRKGPLIVTLAGSAGIGKTQLALRVARSVRQRYPHGVLYASASSVRVAVGEFASALGYQGRKTERDPTSFLREVTADLATLFILDDFRPERLDLEGLLPVGSACSVLVISRSTDGISSRPSAYTMTVPPLDHDASRTLLDEYAKASSISITPELAALAEEHGSPLYIRLLAILGEVTDSASTGVRLGVWSPVTCWFGAGRPRVTLPVLRT
jgi:hypothetical protein